MIYYEVQELACAILGISYDDLVNEGRESEIEEKLQFAFSNATVFSRNCSCNYRKRICRCTYCRIG